jgi:hypothetical protein
LRGAEAGVEFYTADTAFEGGQVTKEQDGVVLYRESIDDLNLCAVRDDNGRLIGGCVKELLEAAAYKPELHSRLLREIRRLEIENEHWRDYAKRLERTLNERPEPAPSARRKA